MSNPHLAQIHALRQNARRFWAAWQQQEAQLVQLSDIEFVEQANDLLRQFCPECIVEREGNAPDSDDLPSLVFSSEGIREHFPQVQALAELAQTQRYHVRAFRSPESSVAPDLSIDDFGIGIGDFLLNTSDVAIALNEWRMLPALEIAFTRPIPTDMCDHAQNIAIIMLDHIIGEWAASVKIGMVDFVDNIAPERAMSFTALPKKLNQMWRELGYTGVYPEPEWQFGTYQIEEDEDREQDALVLMRNESAASLLGRADMGWVVCVEAQLASKADLDAAYELQDSIEVEASLNQQGIFTLSVMNMTNGTRTMYYNSSNPAGLVEKAAVLCEQCPLPAEVSCQYDPNWSYYRF